MPTTRAKGLRALFGAVTAVAISLASFGGPSPASADAIDEPDTGVDTGVDTDVETAGGGPMVELVAPGGEVVEVPLAAALDDNIELTDDGLLVTEPVLYGPELPANLLDALVGSADAGSEQHGAPAETDESPRASDAFTLHSRPGSAKTIYLDFNGHVTAGTPWNNGRDAMITSKPYSRDSNPAFSTLEREYIVRIWETTVEDFAPFDVDVTTEEPTDDELRRTGTDDDVYGTRVVISPSRDWYGSAGGVAYINSFRWHDSQTPAFVFSNSLANGYWKFVAEAASHEAGHTLGLYHDGTETSGYYAGHGDDATDEGWAPIMGVGYYWPTTQWSDGRYPGANQTQDDIAILANRMGWITDRIPAATTLPTLGDGDRATGLVERANAPVDIVVAAPVGGDLHIAITPPLHDSNLLATAALLDGSRVIAHATSDKKSDWSLSLDARLDAGNYTVRIASAGWAGPDGFTKYGSVGYYDIAVDITPEPTTTTTTTTTATTTMPTTTTSVPTATTSTGPPTTVRPTTATTTVQTTVTTTVRSTATTTTLRPTTTITSPEPPAPTVPQTVRANLGSGPAGCATAAGSGLFGVAEQHASPDQVCYATAVRVRN